MAPPLRQSRLPIVFRSLRSLRALLTIGGWLAASVLLWLVGPLLGWGEVHPLADLPLRVAAVGLLAALAAGHAVWRLARVARGNRALMESLLQGDKQGGNGAAAADARPGAHDVAVIGQRFAAAIELLKRGRVGGRRSRFAALTGRPYVYQLPWYVLIGAPGAGKTTALVHSGLEFPLAEQLGDRVVRGIGGTRHCDWWFTNRAVLIDTAGRYTTQDSDRDADRAAWLGFLRLLVRHRPRRPIDGVLLTLSASDLLDSDAERRQSHARGLRARIDELGSELGIRFPVYVLVTKTDLLAGFMEFFGDFDKDERAQVWGVTFPYPEKASISSAPGAGGPLARLGAELAALERRLHEGLIERLRGESDRERCAALYAFPQQWDGLRTAVAETVQAVFAPAGGTAPWLRGVYFTSATQEGTPVDRALGGMVRAMSLAHRAVPPARPSGKTFFVTRLLRDVILAEAGLAGTDARWERRRRRAAWAVVGTTVVFVAGGLGLTTRAWLDNRAMLDAQAPRLQQLGQAVAAASTAAATAPPADLLALVPVLDAVRPAPATTATADAPSAGTSAPPARSAAIALDLGLDRRAMVEAAGRDTYQRLLRESFLPRIAAGLETRLRAPGADDLPLIYEALKAYLMLFDGQHFDRRALRAYLAAAWQQTLPANTPPALREALLRHLDALLASGEVGAPALADAALIAQTRGRVGSVPLAQRLYSRLRTEDPGPAAPPATLLTMAGPEAARVFQRPSGQPLTQGVPGLYTHAVAAEGLRGRAEAALGQFVQEDPWVLGPAAPPAPQAADRAALLDNLEQTWRRDYQRHWDEFLRDLRLVATTEPAATADLARLMAKTDAPLANWVRAVARETASLPPYAAWQRYAAAPPGPLDELLAPLGKLGTQLTVAADVAQRKAGVASADATQEVADAAREAPEPLRGMLLQLAGRSAGQLFPLLREALERQLASEVGVPCRRDIAGRYPLVNTSTDELSPAAFAATFGTGGAFDSYFRRHLAPYVDTSSRPWAWRRAEGSSRDGAEVLLPFQRAQTIRETLLRDAAAGPSARLELRLLELDPGLAQFTLDVDGQPLRFGRDSKAQQNLRWPGPGGGKRVQLLATPTGGGAATSYAFDGPWALWRLFDRVRVEPGASPERVMLLFDVEGRRARFEARSSSPLNPIHLQDLEQFTCPTHL